MAPKPLSLPAFDPASAPESRGSTYPSPFKERVAGRTKHRLGEKVGLTQFGVNLVMLPPGVESSMRHWHTREDELVFVLEGELVLVTDKGEQVLSAGMACGFKAGATDGHQLVNRSTRPARYLEIGTRDKQDECDYPDVDLLVRLIDGEQKYVHKNGKPY